MDQVFHQRDRLFILTLLLQQVRLASDQVGTVRGMVQDGVQRRTLRLHPFRVCRAGDSPGPIGTDFQDGHVPVVVDDLQSVSRISEYLPPAEAQAELGIHDHQIPCRKTGDLLTDLFRRQRFELDSPLKPMSRPPHCRLP